MADNNARMPVASRWRNLMMNPPGGRPAVNLSLQQLFDLQMPGNPHQRLGYNSWRGTVSWFEFDGGRPEGERLVRVDIPMEVFKPDNYMPPLLALVLPLAAAPAPPNAHQQPPQPAQGAAPWPERVHLIMTSKTLQELMPPGMGPGFSRPVVVDINDSPSTRALSLMLAGGTNRTAVIFTNARDELRPSDINGNFLVEAPGGGHGVILITHNPNSSTFRGMVLNMANFRRICAPRMLPEFTRQTSTTGCVIRGLHIRMGNESPLMQFLLGRPSADRAHAHPVVAQIPPAPNQPLQVEIPQMEVGPVERMVNGAMRDENRNRRQRGGNIDGDGLNNMNALDEEMPDVEQPPPHPPLVVGPAPRRDVRYIEMFFDAANRHVHRQRHLPSAHTRLHFGRQYQYNDQSIGIHPINVGAETGSNNFGTLKDRSADWGYLDGLDEIEEMSSDDTN